MTRRFLGRRKPRIDPVSFSTSAPQHRTDELKYFDDGSADASTFAALIHKCARLHDLAQGRRIHGLILRNGIEVGDFLGARLLAMYCKCGSPEEARAVFQGIQDKSVVAWTSLIGVNARSGHPKEAFHLFREMQLQGVMPNDVTYVAVLGACGHPWEVDTIRARVEACGSLELDVIVATAVMNAYGKCGDLDSAWGVFDGILVRDAAVWNAMISLLVAHEQGDEALELFRQMRLGGVTPNKGTCVAALNACCHSRDFSEALRIHAFARELAGDADTVVQTALVNMYGKFGKVDDAEEIFERIQERDVVSWNAMLTANACNGFHDKAFKCFREMLLVGELPSRITYVAILNACFLAAHLKHGDFVKTLAVEGGCGIESVDVVMGTAIMNMYSRCKSPKSAFSSSLLLEQDRDQPSIMMWNTVLSLYVENEQFEEAFTIFRLMLLGGVTIDTVSLMTVFNACGSSASLEKGKWIHSLLTESELTRKTPVQNALVTMYARLGSLEDAREIFDAMTTRNVISWTAMVGVHSQLGLNREALRIFRSILLEGVAPNEVTFTAVLNACGNLASIPAAKLVQACLSETGFFGNVEVANGLLCTLGKCGSLEEVANFFQVMAVKNQVSWNTAIAANAQHGNGVRGVELFQTMQLEGIDTGLVAQGYSYFLNMHVDYGFPAEAEHYSCVIDLLSRAGWLEHAEEFVKRLPFGDQSVFPWITLLCGCKLHGDLERGGRATQRILGLNPGSTGPYLVMHNLYAGAGKWPEAAAVRKSMVELGPKKEPGLSWIEVKGRIHEFRVGDTSHPRSSEIHRELERLNEEMKRAGFVCDIKAVVYDLQAKEKESLLCQHSEKLAIAFGLISTAAGEPLRIMKNLRVCSDCHSATKFISGLVGREIVVRDAYRFHHFRGGACSCEDFW
ncbi:putative pentatricopeptide repeat-containing protein At3g23330 isoform X1 [Selaginella moellendorffii]|uniref:putative pentatricopeptide repeat-containing protein At3g23330 isoform X1 n=1 Tax=Selaginella moellendorffii TaxID=88036 RepID=UPI000D1C5F68|nr:putative pentatricopeptide repeat-containing protein At3g23330 isoform X1 [Selaginella moellendorffii]|eukprot:XP_024543593.1 putative pentatricopeptide repeat-containing protein At3g23330 isoform X1 [Selaginella moellendorffii]